MIYDMVRKDIRVVDIGTDHGYLLSKLILDNKCTYGIGTDISYECLKKAQITIKKYHLTDKINILQSDGLNNINEDEVDDIVISGMGSELIVKIIDNCSWSKKINNKHFILQPMNKPWILREYLFNNQFQIIKEDITYSKNLFYVCITAKFLKKIFIKNKLDKFIGILPHNQNEYTKKYFFYLSRKFYKIAKRLPNEDSYHEKYNYYTNLYPEILDIANSLK